MASEANAGSGPKNTKGIQDNVVSETSEYDRSEKEKILENLVHDDASETNTAINSPSESFGSDLFCVDSYEYVSRFV
ncbi:hypothetical protein A2U01_0074052 [Trifolium medium]|uniref:Uncharacterized protein n=1 Tax=Trifolium medium TaxID=97028 RepID=A0A392SY43_9FABA|nr:hypothetical protein [Trifolium medium]